VANKKRTHNLSNRQVSKIFDIPYPTVCDWSTRDKNSNWRPNLLSFLASLSLEEIEIIKNRSVVIQG
jgi:hypothetical protein